MEHIRPESIHLPHKDLECVLEINGEARVFSTSDTAYWIYPEQYSAFNHIVKELEDGTYTYLFGYDTEDYDALYSVGITQITPPYPSQEVITYFWNTEMAHFDYELKCREQKP